MSAREEAKKKYGPQVKHWTDKEVDVYLEVGKVPDKTKRGVWVNDILRGVNLKQWSQEALLDWVDGFIKAPEGRDPSELWEEIYIRWSIPGNWEDEDIRIFLKSGKKPEEVEPGILKNDKIRNSKDLGQLNYTDFRLILNKIVESPFTDEEIINEIRSRMKLSADFPSARILETLPFVEADRSMSDNLLTSKLQEYKTARLQAGPKTSIQTHAAAQTGLFKTIMMVMDREYPAFVKGWDEILDFINKEYSVLFSELNGAMGISQTSLSATEKMIFSDLLNLMIHTRKPGRRQMEARIYNLQTILRNVKSDRRRENVIQYYTLD